jgi:tetratricopeptide (TPR) repeat protein
MTEQSPAEAQAEAARGVAEYDAAIRMASGTPAAAMTKLNDRRAECRTLEGDAWAAQAQSPKEGTDSGAAAAQARAVYDEAEAYWFGRVGADPSSQPAARWLGVTRDKLAVLTTSRGTVLARQARTLQGTDLSGAAALVQKAADRFGEARAMAETALADFRRLSSEHPENAEWRRDIYLALHNIGTPQMNAGDAYSELAKAARAAGPDAAAIASDAEAKANAFWTSAAAAFAEAQRVTDDLAGSDQSNLLARRDQIVIQNKAGNILRNLGRLAEAEEAFRRSLDVRRDLDLTDPTPQTKRDVAVGAFKVGEVLDLEAQKAEITARKRELWQQAEGLLAQAAAAFEGKDKTDARARLDEVRQQLGKLPP